MRATAPRWAILRMTGAPATRSAVVWGWVSAVVVLSSVVGYRSLYRTVAARQHLATQFAGDPAVSALIGPARDVATVEGFTAWRGLVILNVVGAVWGVLRATRLLRGEEEAGRTEMVLAGAVTARRACGAQLAGMGLAAGVLWAVPAAATAVAGGLGALRASPGAAAFVALAFTSNAVVFLGVGAVASQVAPTRRQAAALGGLVVGGAYVLRMVADSGSRLSWLRWATPIGWAEDLRPLAGSRAWPLAPLLGTAAALGALAVHLAGRRDLGASVVADRVTAPPRLALLGSAGGLAVRVGRGLTVGWWLAIGGVALMMGLVATSAGQVLSSSPSTRQVIARLTGRGEGAAAYLGVAFLIVAALLAALAAGEAAAAREEEASGRLDALLAGPLGRFRWLGARLALAAAGLMGAALVAGVLAWCGTTSQGGGVGLGRLLAAGVNAAAPAAVVLGAGVAALGVWPRGVATVGYAALAWSFLVEMVGGVIGMNHWLLDTSVFHHLSAAPATDPDWAVTAVLVCAGAALCVGGAAAFARRDVIGP